MWLPKFDRDKILGKWRPRVGDVSKYYVFVYTSKPRICFTRSRICDANYILIQRFTETLLCLLHFLRGQALLPSKKIHHPYYTQNRVLEWCSGFSVSVIIPADSYCQHVVLCHGLQKNLGLLMFTGAA